MKNQCDVCEGSGGYMRENCKKCNGTGVATKNSAYKIWKDAKEQNLTKEQFREKLIDQKSIVKKCIYCQLPTSGINVSYYDRCLLKDDYSN